MDVLDNILAEILTLVDAERITEDIVELAQIEQSTDFDSFSRSADYLHRRFLALGAESEILQFPADGVTKFQCWTAPIGFRTTRAICSIVEPHACKKVLGDRAIEPNTAIVGTGHTGPEGITAQVVHVTDPARIAAMDLQDKIVYCSDLHPASIRQAVIKGGGKAIVSSYTKHRELNRRYVHWVNTWDAAPDGWLPTARARRENLPGISISPEMGDDLQDCLARGPVTLRIITEGEYFESTFPGVAASFSGEQDRYVLLTGHLFEQGLTDNAAGVMVSYWVSRIIRELEKRPNACPIRRGVRNFHSQECYGALALREYYPDIPAKALVHLNVDMTGVAEPPMGLLPGLSASAGIGGFLMRLILDRAHAPLSACRYERKKKFDINCTLLADPLLGGIPTTQLEQLNPMWHTSRDRGDVLAPDRDMIAFTTLAAATWTYFLVIAGDKEAEWLLRAYKEDVVNELKGGKVADTQLYLALKEREMSSIAALVSPKQRPRLLDEVHRFIADVEAKVETPQVIVPGGNEQQTARSKQLFPRALLGGPAVAECFTLAQLADIGSPKWDSVQLVLKSWADGTRSIYDITRHAIFETGASNGLGYVLTLFEHYAAQGIVSLD